MAKILVVDDAEFLRVRISKMLVGDGYEVIEAENGALALAAYKSNKPDVVLMDITMPEMDGLTALREILAVDSGAKVIMLTALGQESVVLEAIKSGAKVITGGKREKAFYPPTALTNVPVEEKVVCHEVFGPIVIIEPYENYSQALELVENSDFGLQAGVFTQDISHILEAYDKINAGGIMINDVPTFRVDQMPYGGQKDSGFGREGIRYSMEEYCHIRHLMINQSQKT